MSEFDQLGGELHQARSDKAAAQQKLFESQEKVKQLQAQQAQFQRAFDPQNQNNQQQMAVLQRRLEAANGAVIKARFEHERLSQVEQGIFNRLATINAFAEVVHGIKDTFDEPNLVTFGIKRPCTTENDNLDFVGGVSGVVVALQAGIGLQIGIEAVLFGTLSTGFIR